MKFGIEKETLVVKTDLRGNVLYKNVVYKVYRKIFFGLFRLYVKIRPRYVGNAVDEYMFEYCTLADASDFTLHDARMLISDMTDNPSRFVRYK